MDFLKPNFSNHWGNYLFIFLAFFFGFLPASFVFAESFHFVQKSGETMTQLHSRVAADCGDKRYYWQSMGFSGWSESYSGGNCSTSSSRDGDGPNADASRFWTLRKYMEEGECSGYSGSSYLTASGKCQVQPSVAWYEHASGNCPNGGLDEDNDGVCDPVITNCSELQGETWEYSNPDANYAPTEMCNKGCSSTISGIGVYLASEGVAQDYTYTGNSCPGGTGYDPSKGTDEPEYNPEAPPKICKDANGYMYGSVSANAECPTRQNCYDETTGEFTATASGSSTCPTGTTTNAEKDWQENVNTGQTSESTTNPDGSTETTTETTYEHTGSDGKTYTTTKRSTTTCDPEGNCTTSTSETTAQSACEGDDCPEGMQKPEVGSLEDCSKEFVCKGDVLQCARLSVEWKQACSLTQNSLQEWLNSDDFQDNYAAGEDAHGQLDHLGQGGTFDVGSYLGMGSWLGDDGATAACPAPVESGWITVDISPFCDWASMIRGPLIAFNVLSIIFFYRRSLLGG